MPGMLFLSSWPSVSTWTYRPEEYIHVSSCIMIMSFITSCSSFHSFLPYHNATRSSHHFLTGRLSLNFTSPSLSSSSSSPVAAALFPRTCVARIFAGGTLAAAPAARLPLEVVLLEACDCVCDAVCPLIRRSASATTPSLGCPAISSGSRSS